MNNIFEFAVLCLHSDNVNEKVAVTRQASALLQDGLLDFDSCDTPEVISATRFPVRPELQDPRTMPRRKFTTEKGQIAFFHAIAHIEFMAINLAWDLIYRFRGLPAKFYQDWLGVASEEALHFSMLQEHMRKFAVAYGDLPAHSGLWDVAEDTADDVLARLALVPRYMEAHGLDVTPAIIEKFTALNDRPSIALLTRILHDEVGHVQLGSYWFKRLCAEQQLDAEAHYQYLIRTRLKGNPRSQMNRVLRKKAGFSDAELDWLEGFAQPGATAR